MSTLDVIVEYDHIDTDHLERSVRGLEREGYQVWMNLPLSMGETPRSALSRRAMRKTGLYAVYSEGPIGVDDMQDAIHAFGQDVDPGNAVDDTALTMFACLRGAPDLPEPFRKLHADDIRIDRSKLTATLKQTTREGARMTFVHNQNDETAPDSDNDDATRQAAPMPGTLFGEVMRKRMNGGARRGYDADTAPGRTPLTVNFARKSMPAPSGFVVDPPAMRREVPLERDVQPAIAVKEPAEDSIPQKDVLPQPGYQSTPDTEQLTPQPRFRPSMPAMKAPSITETLHMLSGLALGATFVTFVITAMVLAGAKNMTAGSVATTALLCALAPFCLFFVLKSFESRARQSEAQRA